MNVEDACFFNAAEILDLLARAYFAYGGILLSYSFLTVEFCFVSYLLSEASRVGISIFSIEAESFNLLVSASFVLSKISILG